MMMEGAGFEVINIGINNPVENYLNAMEEHKPDIVGMSALLTTTMPYMKVVIDTMKEKGIRDDYIVLVGGAPLNEEFGKAVGADAYCRDAAVAVETAKDLIKRRHNRRRTRRIDHFRSAALRGVLDGAAGLVHVAADAADGVRAGGKARTGRDEHDQKDRAAEICHGPSSESAGILGWPGRAGNAISQAMERSPSATLTIGAPSPLAGEGERRAPEKVLVIACGALAREIGDIVAANGLHHIELTCLPAQLHIHPEKIPEAVRGAVRKARAAGYERIAVGYADCGTGGLLDKVCAEEGVERIAGPHCYSFYWGNDSFADREEDDIDAFFLTDFLARQFDSFVIEPLGLDRHPELRDMYFGNYRRLVFLAQTEDAALEAKARAAADRLGLRFEMRKTGMGDLAPFLTALNT